MSEQRINLNRTSAEELMELPGIGATLAQRIIAYRNDVRPFREPSEIVAVSGVGQRIYGKIADHVMTATSDETRGSARDEAQSEMGQNDASQASADRGVSEETRDEGISESDPTESAAEADVVAVPPGESLSEDVQPLGEEHEESTEAPREEPTLSESESENEATALEAAPEPAEGPEAVAEDEQPEAGTAEEEGPAPSREPRPQTTPAPWWRRLSWLWTAVLGAVLGMIFALVVFAGINGSLDVGHSRAVLRIQGDVDSLTMDVQTLGDQLEGLRDRLQAMEELTPRVEAVEGAVKNLHGETATLGEQITTLDEDVVAVSEELDDLSEDVTALQQEADQTRSFFGGLQGLLEDIFGENEAASVPTPTPEEK